MEQISIILSNLFISKTLCRMIYFFNIKLNDLFLSEIFQKQKLFLAFQYWSFLCLENSWNDWLNIKQELKHINPKLCQFWEMKWLFLCCNVYYCKMFLFLRLCVENIVTCPFALTRFQCQPIFSQVSGKHLSYKSTNNLFFIVSAQYNCQIINYLFFF